MPAGSFNEIPGSMSDIRQRLAAGSGITGQGVTKHLEVPAGRGMIRGSRRVKGVCGGWRRGGYSFPSVVNVVSTKEALPPLVRVPIPR